MTLAANRSRVKAFNEAFAVRATKIFGSMWTTYAFAAYGFLPVLVPAWMTALLYWSNTVQLWSLPLLLVGSAVLARGTQQLMERLIRETHDAVMEELDLAREERDASKQLLATLTEELALVRQLAAKLLAADPQDGGAA
jgi:hypothetical protein